MPDRAAQLAVGSADELGECPVWDERTQLLYRVDTVAGSVQRLDVDTGVERRYELGRRVGSSSYVTTVPASCSASRKDSAR